MKEFTVLVEMLLSCTPVIEAGEDDDLPLYCVDGERVDDEILDELMEDIYKDDQLCAIAKRINTYLKNHYVLYSGPLSEQRVIELTDNYFFILEPGMDRSGQAVKQIVALCNLDLAKFRELPAEQKEED